jgi:hypothetical protein
MVWADVKCPDDDVLLPYNNLPEVDESQAACVWGMHAVFFFFFFFFFCPATGFLGVFFFFFFFFFFLFFP